MLVASMATAAILKKINPSQHNFTWHIIFLQGFIKFDQGIIIFSEAIALIEPKLCINHWKVLYKLCVFYVDRNSKMTTTPAVAAILNFISEQKT
jgi:hypothetical protein